MQFQDAQVPELAWIKNLFTASRANGGVLIRNRKGIPGSRSYNADLADLKVACQKRGYHLLQTGDYYVVICNDGEMKVHC